MASSHAQQQQQQPRASPFTRAVVQAMRKLYPESIADKSFDNTGLMLEAPFDPSKRQGRQGRRQRNSVLLTIDLTKAVADEAIERGDSVVVAYHPIIFRGLKSLTLADTQQQSLLRLALEGISVYSPHTAVDAAPGGLGDWMADIVAGSPTGPPSSADEVAGREPAQQRPREDSAIASSSHAASSTGRPGMQRAYSRPTYPSGWTEQTATEDEAESAAVPHTRSVLQPSPNPPAGFEGAGVGRLIRFERAVPLTGLIERIARGVGTPKGFPVAVPQGRAVDGIAIRTVAVCAGSGAGAFRGTPADDADLLFTGELAHHDALAATERGACVVALFHSNSERGFLHRVMRAQLQRALAREWDAVRREDREFAATADGDGLPDAWHEVLEDDEVTVDVSERDRDPYGIVVLEESKPATGPP